MICSCLVEDCEKRHYARGYCQRHYDQWRKGRSFTDPQARWFERLQDRKDLICAFPDCLIQIYRNDYCAGHFTQFRRGKSLKPLRKYKKRKSEEK